MQTFDQSCVDDEINYYLSHLSPTEASNEKRYFITEFLNRLLSAQLGEMKLVVCGSTALKSYLAESDLDLMILSPSIQVLSDEMKLLVNCFSSLCQEIYAKEEGKSKNQELIIRNVELINARTKLIHCFVNNIGVDITFNQFGAITTLVFLEEADRLIGCDHLLKRSLLLIKVNFYFVLNQILDIILGDNFIYHF